PMVVMLCFAPASNAQVFRQEAPVAGREAVVIELHEDINSLSGEIFKRKYREAVDRGVDVIIIDIQSPGGELGMTTEIVDMVLESEVETIAMIKRDAVSGAALLALSCDQIFVRPSARMGDAGVIQLGLLGVEYAEEKFRTPVAQKARDLAKAHGRPESLAEKMVDKDLVVYRSTNKETGEVRYLSNREWESLSDDEAAELEKGKPVREAGEAMFFMANGERLVELGMADATFNTEQDVFSDLGVKTPVNRLGPTFAENIARFLNTGWMTFFLIVIGLIAIGVELSAPGISVGGLTALLCFSLFFWSRFAAGTSTWLEVMLFFLGLIFIACEIFVIPGFGVAGLGGIALVIGSLVMASRRFIIPEDPSQWADLGSDLLTVVSAIIVFFVVAIGLSTYLGKVPGLSRLTLQPSGMGRNELSAPAETDTVVQGAVHPSAAGEQVNIDDQGFAEGPLRPAGRIRVGDLLVDVVTEGDFVEDGSLVKVIGKRGGRIVVQAI
ncbi:MAG: peptidase, partial [Planctomycetota bacterium]